MYTYICSHSLKHHFEEFLVIYALVFLLSLALNQAIQLGHYTSYGPMRVTELLLHQLP